MKFDNLSKFVTCWRMKLSNGKLLCFTDCDEDIFFVNEKYICGGYFTPSKIYSSSELGEDNFTIHGIIDEKIIKRKALLSGCFSECYLEVFLINLAKQEQEKIILKTGWFGEIKLGLHDFTAKVCSLSSKMNKVITKCYSSTCRADFADSHCMLEKEKFNAYGEVGSIIGENSFVDNLRVEPDDYYNKGILMFISGINKGIKYEVCEFKNKVIILDYMFPLEINIGDKYSIRACFQT